jgi:hypothetical protein
MVFSTLPVFELLLLQRKLNAGGVSDRNTPAVPILSANVTLLPSQANSDYGWATVPGFWANWYYQFWHW